MSYTYLAADNSAKHLDYLAAHLMILAQHFERNFVLYTGSTYVKISGVWNVNHFWLIYGLFLTYLFFITKTFLIFNINIYIRLIIKVIIIFHVFHKNIKQHNC